MISSCLVVLNYNDSERCLNVINFSINNNLFDNYVLVDNGSEKNEIEKLENNKSKETILIKNNFNLGYGAGHNVGLRYAIDILKSDYVAIIVSDIEYTADNIKSCVKVLKDNPKIGAVTCRMKDINGFETEAAWRTPTYLEYILWCFPIIRKCIKKRHYSYDDKKLYSCVDVIRGSFMYFRSEALRQCGYFDEKVFLYNEENIISSKLKKIGYDLAIVNGQFYVHNHINSTGTKKSFNRLLKDAESGIYYMKNYQNVKGIKLTFLRFSTYLLCLQRYIIQHVR